MFASAAAEKGQGRRCLIAGWAAAMVLTVASGCGSVGDTTDSSAERPAIERSAPRGQAETAAEPVAPSHCPADLPSCRTVEGRIVYVERVDPDGDGDAHFVVVDQQGLTLPGLTAIDVRKGLRPHPLPGPGALISAAGPVQTGSYGQSQIHALELHVAGR
ncbi:MAG: hypothetical protein QOF13_513 [Solirubrobacterales bacterium]|jgi:uncharacterized protein YceK|nr:hypothetical protein [Solirubrobacterales bacterium]